MPPVARRFIEYGEGSPRRVLQDAVLARYDPLELFFKALAETLNVQQDSAAGTYYGFMSGKRPLPETHKRAYIDLTGVDPLVIAEIGRARPTATRYEIDETDRLRAIVREELERALRGQIAEVRVILERLERRVGGILNDAAAEEQTG